MFVLIPAFEPGPRMPALVTELLRADPDLDVLVVDDGSGPAFAPAFAAARSAGARVIAHARNRGKGAALKTGFAHITAQNPDADVVTADADGQHTPADVCRVADALRRDAADGRSALVLGVRGLRGEVPLRSRLGNAAARGLFRLATGRRLSDTQTGLRGIPSDRLPWALGIPGDGFEYEQRMLLRLGPDQLAAHEVPIDTVYLDRNASSHFRPVRDSLRVLLPVLLFASSSLAAFAVDTVALLVLQALTGWLVPSIVAARVLSATANFVVNRRVVFRARGGSMLPQAVRYGVLALALLASNIAWMSFLTDNGLALLPAKVVTEGVLFVLSYGVQRALVFPRTDAGPPARPPMSRPDRPHAPASPPAPVPQPAPQVPEPVEGTGARVTPGGVDELSLLAPPQVLEPVEGTGPHPAPGDFDRLSPLRSTPQTPARSTS
ncbi:MULTISPECIES: bifunctional glycosyltransferase family 2/GtrA family protein [Microbacterium]|uniref:bifunctional glycosyltransferase family 2/GtrA family protein n=1 Tax=Microbacterium TaxID=33882 RepID=UPI0027859516|nr:MULTISPECIES: bifunctional glycosyltransferase family 2/GtrA family protein [Microbacterium]MDQ1083117.1 putative flippase GtrA [Microbacterium sp. SORGH_AS_0344]MDQ1171611.1 putative flippase GtrA [Microbacterium proteolyticum]